MDWVMRVLAVAILAIAAGAADAARTDNNQAPGFSQQQVGAAASAQTDVSVSVGVLVTPIWESIKALANSAFGSSLLAAMAGAWGGAWAAQRIAETGKLRDRLYQEILDTNAAVELTAMVTTTYFNFKKQIVVDIAAKYEIARTEAHREHAKLIENLHSRSLSPVRLMPMEMNMISPVHVRFDRLEDIVMSKLAVAGRVRPTIATLVQCILALDETIKERNEMLSSVRAEGESSPTTIAKIFGLPIASGIDLHFGQNITALQKQSDDCIQFGIILGEDLMLHGKQLRENYKKQYRGRLPSLVSVDWSGAAKRGLLPNPAEYTTWQSNFVKRLPNTEGRHLGRLRYACKQRLREFKARSQRARAQEQFFSGLYGPSFFTSKNMNGADQKARWLQ